jgi:hypothetical protein
MARGTDPTTPARHVQAAAFDPRKHGGPGGEHYPGTGRVRVPRRGAGRGGTDNGDSTETAIDKEGFKSMVHRKRKLRA